MKDTYLKQSLDYRQQAAVLYALLGQAVWLIQHLEDALSHSIALKNPEAITKEKGDKILNSNRELTLGKAVKRAEKEKTYGEFLQKRLEDFLDERNWLIHRCMHENVDETGMILDEQKLFKRIKDIQLSALSLKEAIEIDMLEFTSARGREDIRDAVAKSYAEWLKRYG